MAGRRIQNVAYLLKHITVEPVMLLFTLGLGLYPVAYVNLYFDKVCKVGSVWFGNGSTYSDEVCDNIVTGRYREAQEDIQSQVFKLTTVSGVIQNVPSLIFVLFIGPWSDRYGRKPLLILPTIGYLLMSGVILVNVIFFDELVAEWMLLEAVQDFTGGLPCALAGIYAYISDVSEPEWRTARLAMVEFAFMLGAAASEKASGALLVNFGYIAVFVTAPSVLLVALLYIVIFVKEPTRSRKKLLSEQKGNESKNGEDGQEGGPDTTPRSYKKLLDAKNFKNSFNFMFKARKDNMRTVLLFCGFILLTRSMTVRGDRLVTAGYARQQFKWDSIEDYTSWFTTYRSVIIAYRGLGVAVLLPLLNRYLGIDDAAMVLFGLLGYVIDLNFTLIAREPYFLYIGSAINVLHTAVVVCTRSISSKAVPAEDIGTLFGCWGAVQAVSELTIPLYTWIYAQTIAWHPGFVFCLLCTLLVITLPMAAFIYINQKRIDRRTTKMSEKSH